MDTRLRPFRNLEPFEGYPIRDVAFSTTGDKILICSGSGAVKVRNAATNTAGGVEKDSPPLTYTIIPPSCST
jgi:hypothetical protein